MSFMKSGFSGVTRLGLVFCALLSVGVSAEPWSEPTWRGVEYDFIDVVDRWGPLGVLDTVPIVQGLPLSYEHDIRYRDIQAHSGVAEVWLELDFTNDLTDSQGSALGGLIQWDFREFIRVGYDGQRWESIGEVDSDYYPLVVDVDWLNDDGILDVTIDVSNPLGTGIVWLDHSVLYGNLVTTPLPPAILVGLFGLGITVWRLRKVA